MRVRRALAIAGTLAIVAANVALAGSAASPGTISTVAQLDHPRGIAVEPSGSFLVAQPFENVVRRVFPDGSSAIVAGTGEAGYGGDGGPATAALLNFVHCVAVLPAGGFVLADTRNDSVRAVAPDGTIRTVAGVGSAGFAGDGGPATAARLWAPHGVAVRRDGALLIADTDNNRVRLIVPDGTISTVAGTGSPGFSGDGGLAVSAQLDEPFGVAPLPAGGFLVVSGNRVRKVSVAGTIATVAGTGKAGFSGDGGPATAAQLDQPHNVAVLADGGFLIADAGNARVRRVSPSGTITTVAGTGVAGYAGDGGPAVAAELDMPKAVAVLGDASGFLVGDAENDRVRVVSADLRAPLTVRTSAAITAKHGKAARLPVALSDRAAIRLDVLRGQRVVLRVRVARSAGKSTIAFGRTLAPATYALKLTATAADGRRATASSRLAVRK